MTLMERIPTDVLVALVALTLLLSALLIGGAIQMMLRVGGLT